MARRWVVRNSDNVIIEYTEWAGRVATADETIYTDPANDEGWVQGGTYDGTTYADPAGRPTKAVRTRDSQLILISDAYQNYHRNVRKQGWVSLRSGAGADQGIIATDRWVYQQIAMADRIARGEWLAASTQEFRDAAVNHIVNWVGAMGYTWYSAVIGVPGRATLTSWAATSIAPGAGIYTDILIASGATIGTPRTPATEFTLINPALTIHTNFDPEFPTLRSA